ncbi:uncharacterized protein LOC105029866 isoform X2 [Esox lucius]|uniref:uncharacterized protein LOC105029866 isoform X2 n=1 Tax=Esox lucius TaxID=8010 RepID=UPI001476BFA0|nr:uncharacterized protein LOC105029866 isoform X2 [Esox lucius]
MSKLQSFRLFLNERLTAVAVEIFEAARDTFIEYQEENDRLCRLLQISPEIELSTIDSLQFSLSVSEEEVLPEQQAWNPSLGQENTEVKQIKEEQEELSTSQEKEQHHEVFHTKHAIFTSTCVKSECDQEDPFGSFVHPQTQTVENRESDSKPTDIPHFDTVTHLTGLSNAYGSPSHEINAFNHNSAVSSDTVEFYNSPPVDRSPSVGHSPPVDKHCSKPRTSSKTTHHCRDCGETFKLKANLQNHVTFSKRPSECSYCKKCYDSTCKLRAHVQLCHVEKLLNSMEFCTETRGFTQERNHLAVVTVRKSSVRWGT